MFLWACPAKERGKRKIKPSKGARGQPCAFAGFQSFPICGEHTDKNKAATYLLQNHIYHSGNTFLRQGGHSIFPVLLTRGQLFLCNLYNSFFSPVFAVRASRTEVPIFHRLAALAAACAAAAAVIARLVVFVQRPQGKAHAKAHHTDYNDIAKHSALLSLRTTAKIRFLTCGRSFRPRPDGPYGPPGTPGPPGQLPPEW